MGIVKIDDTLHEDLRRASGVMCRSINAQAEYWIKIGMLAEANPTLTFPEIIRRQMEAAALPAGVVPLLSGGTAS
ncbi:ParD-like family protein [Novispirillum itersonii]|uniref:ParD-like family protein n=1 Tax=Novispirillum itersonii TaxID=189 RepID=UPI000382DE34|nr:ParD-like family protein [Novispirillum itersonii]